MVTMTRSEQRAARGQRATDHADAAPRRGRGKKRTSERAGEEQDSKRRGRGGDKPAEALVPTLPTVNLLPPAVIERAHVERLRRRFGVAVGLAVVAVAVAYVLQAGAISTANDDLAAEQARTTQLSARVTALAPVRVYYAAVEANAATIQQTMAREVLVSDVVARLYDTAPDGVGLDTVDITVDTQPVPAETPAASTGEPAAPAVPAVPTTSGACPSPDPYLPPDATAGCIAITGSAASREELGRWEASLGRTNLFADLFISDSQAAAEDGADAITFTASVSITAKAYTDRYADQAFLEGAAR